MEMGNEVMRNQVKTPLRTRQHIKQCGLFSLHTSALHTLLGVRCTSARTLFISEMHRLVASFSHSTPYIAKLVLLYLYCYSGVARNSRIGDMLHRAIHQK